MVGELVDLFVLVLLQLLDLVEAVDFFDVDASLVEMVDLFSNEQNVAEAIEQHLDELGILGCEQVADGLDDLAFDQVEDLFSAGARCVVGDGPSGFLLHAKLTVGQHVDEEWNKLSLDHGLDLGLGASGDVGQCPGSLLLNADLLMRQQGVEDGQSARVNDALCLVIGSGDNVANATESRAQDAHVALLVKVQQLDQSWHSTCQSE